MIFWTSFLVFLASIMIYLLLPARTDQIALDHYRDDPLVVSFVNQHQAAKNYIDQMVMWQTSGELSTTPIHPLDNTKLEKFMPKGMQSSGGLYHDIGTQENINNDVFVSGMICLDPSNQLAECTATNNSYIITYGYVPSWWDITNMGRQGYWEGTDSHENSVIVVEHLWLKPMLRRTHGTTLCGRLVFPTDSGNPAGAYMIDNGQEYGGFDTKKVAGKTYKTIPNSIGDELKRILPNGPIQKTENGRRHVFICMTPYKNPYAPDPTFHWDFSNNQNGKGHQSIASNNFGTTLVGNLSGKEIQWGIDGEPSNYTLSGTVKKGWTSGTILMNFGSSQAVKIISSDSGLALSIGDTVWAPLPDDGKAFSFTYEGNTSSSDGATPRQRLTVSYTVCHPAACGGTSCPNRCDLNPMTWETSDTPAPTLSAVTLESTNLLNVIFYRNRLSDGDVAQNNKANHHRFGI